MMELPEIDTAGLRPAEIDELLIGYAAAPKLIYLQRNDDDPDFPRGASWCEDQIDQLDVTYVRLDLCIDIQNELDKERLFIALDKAQRGSKEADCLLEQTRTFDEHPDWYDDACECQLCCSYGD